MATETIHETIHLELKIDGTEYECATSIIHEAVSTIGSLECELTQVGGAPDPATLIGGEAQLTIKRQVASDSRLFKGMVIEADRCADRDGRPMVRARVAPRLWKTTKRTNCRIFQEMTANDIITQVLEEAGIPAADQEWNAADCAERIYCCQYRETDFEFVMRLMSEEGIIFAVNHTDEGDKVLFTDDGTGLGDVEPKTLPFATTTGFDQSEPQVMWLTDTRTVKTDKIYQRDYDFERPKYKLEAEAEGSDDGDKNLEVYVYPGRFVEDAVGEKYANALLNAIQSERWVVGGETTLLTMIPAHRITVEEHPYEDFNQELMIVGIETTAHETVAHGGDEGSAGRDYTCRFTAVPTSDTKYKAPRRHVSADIPGVQTAFTTGPSGSEIHPDEHGRVKCRFLWDRTDPQDDTSSCWIRSEQSHTPDSMLLPRMKWEVQLRFMEGDVDRPMVLGRMYNALAPPPYGLPDAKSRSSVQTNTSPGDGSSNEMRFNDSGGGEEMFINASKDLTMNVGNNMTLDIGNNETRDIGSNHTMTVTNSLDVVVGANQTVDVGSNQTVKVETFMVDDVTADHSLSVGANRDLKVGGDHKHTVTGNQTQNVGANQFDIVVGKVEEKADGSWTHDVGAALVEVTGGNRDYTVGGSRTENVGAVKLVATKAGRGVEIGGELTNMVAGAIVNKVKGDKSDKSGGAFTDIVAGAQIVKADNIAFEGESLVAVVMGASTLIVSAPAILLAGTSVKWDGATKDLGALIVDN